MNPRGEVRLLRACVAFVLWAKAWSWAGEVAAPAFSELGDFSFRSWRSEHGLPQLNPRALLQTSDGYLWVGTLNGLARFDGVRFENFTAGNTPELFSDTINALYEAHAGTLWIGTMDGGLARYHRGRFTRFSNEEGLGSITINSLVEDGDGMLWVGTAGGLHRMVSSNRFERVAPSVVPVEVVAGLQRSREGDVWVITLQAIRRLRHGQLVHPLIQSPRVIRCFELDQFDDLWLGFEDGGIARVHAGTMTLSDEKLAVQATALCRDRSGNLWLGSSSGELWRREPQGTWTRVGTPVSSGILAMHGDSSGNLWLGIEQAGLCRLREKMLTTHTTEHGPLRTHLTSVVEDNQGRIWAGTMGNGLFAWAGNSFVSVPITPTAVNVTSLLFDRKGTFICGTFHVHHGQLYRRENNEFVAEPGFGRQCRTLFEDRDGGLWVGKWRGGVDYYKDGHVTRYVPKDGLSNDRIFSITQDQPGAVWIGTLNGLNRLVNGKFACFYREHGLGGNDVRVLFVDREGTLWAGSTGGGLTRYQNGRFATLTARQGLLSDSVEQILQDDDGNLWLGSNAGIMRASLRELNDCASGSVASVNCAAFRQEDGLLLPGSGTGFQPSCLKTSTGQLWFGNEAGVVVIDPKRIKSNPKPPLVHIEKLLMDGEVREVYSKPAEVAVIPSGRQRLEFHYTGLDLSAPTAVHFKYKLEGYDPDWLDAGRNREAIYTRVPPGGYRFQVMAANSAGVWSAEAAALALRVLPSWWQTWWFRGALAAGLAGLIFGVFEFRNVQHKKALAVQESFSRRLIESQEQERKRVATELHDSLGQSLQIIKGRAELGLNRTSDQSECTRQFEEISDATAQGIREVQAISQALRPAELDQLGLTRAVEWMARQASVPERTRFACELDPIDGLLPPEVEISLYRIAQEGINNVLKHAGASEAVLELKRDNGLVRLSLFDNGRGFVRAHAEPTSKRLGHGLAGIAERVKLLGGQFTLQSEPGRGTRLTVECQIPAKKHAA